MASTITQPETPQRACAMTALTEIGRDECLQLLASQRVGRIAVNAPGWPPVIRPVNFLFDERTRSVVFRSDRGSKLTALLTGRAAFEVDEIGEDGGWSVIVQGRVEQVTNAAELARLERAGLRSWVPGELPHWLRLSTTAVSGRRLSRVETAADPHLPMQARTG